MKTNYHDIVSRIAKPPLWWDDQGVPRYEPFHPTLGPVYTQEVALILVACQCCLKTFPALVTENMQRYWNSILKRSADDSKPRNLSDAILDGSISYGDPPNACCHQGASMESIPQKVLEYWYNPGKGPYVEPDFGWVRGKGLEFRLDTD